MANKSLIDNPEDIQLKEFGEIQQILGHPPGWMLRWGISMIFLATILLFLLAWLIKYPDVIPAQAVVTTENPPSIISSHISGNIAEVLVEDGQTVKEGALLLILENAAKLEDIRHLENILAPLPTSIQLADLEGLELPPNLELGKNVQGVYSQLSFNLKNLQYNLNQGAAGKRIRALGRQRSNLDNLNASLKRRMANLEKELKLEQKDLDRIRQLAADGIESPKSLEAKEAQYLRIERNQETMRAEMIKNRLEIDRINAQILDLRQNDGDTKNTFFETVKEDIEQLKSELSRWNQDFLVLAPMDGSITIPKTLTAQQFVQPGEEIMAIVPKEGAGAIIAKAELSAFGLGKVKEGMDVHLRLEGYPYKEFGMVIGAVKNISDVPSTGANGLPVYTILIDLPNGLQTTYDENLNFRQGMVASANVITQNRTVLERLFDRILDIIKNRT